MGYILTKKESHIYYIYLNRPEELNALNIEMVQELEKIIDSVGNDNSLRVIIITGTGDKYFCAGADVKEMYTMTTEEALVFSSYTQMVFAKLANLTQPVIAAVNGFAFGGGWELASACDLRIASANAMFCHSELTLGIIPGFGGTQRLIQLVGPAKTKELIFTGKKLTADEALTLGIINKVVAYGLSQSAAYELATNMVNLAPLALAQAKKVINYHVRQLTTEATETEASCFSFCFSTVDQVEGMEAFLNKRKPNFTGQ